MTAHVYAIPGFAARIDERAVPWRSTSYPGIEWYRLSPGASGARTTDEAAVLIRMAPGSGYPGHRHVGPEDVLVLAGGYRDEFGVHTAGSYLQYPAGSEHNPIATGVSGRPIDVDNPACLLFTVTRGTVGLWGVDDGAGPQSRRQT